MSLGLDRRALEPALGAANQWFQTAVFAHHGRTRELWSQYEEKVLNHAGIYPLAPGLASRIQESFSRVTWNRVYPETREVLDALRERRYPLHVISNATDEVLDRLRELNLAEYFASVTYSQEAGANKPNPAPFRMALRRSGREPEETVHIGNMYQDDVQGARGVGIAPILVDRGNERPDADCLRVRDLRGVIDILD